MLVGSNVHHLLTMYVCVKTPQDILISTNYD